jgi:Na+-driven multidrug efflux pump
VLLYLKFKNTKLKMSTTNSPSQLPTTDNPLHSSINLGTHLIAPESIEHDAKLLSSWEAFVEAWKRSYGFIRPRILVLLKSLFNAFFAAEFSNPDAAVGLAIGTLFQQLALSVIKAGTGPIDNLFAKSNAPQNEPAKTGPLIYQAMIINTVVSIPIMGLFFLSNIWLREIGLNPSVAEETAKFLQAFAIAVWGVGLNIVDQGWLLSQKRKWSPTILSTFFVSVTMAISYPMALSTQNIAWFGYGLSSAAWLTFVAGRIHLYLNKTEGVLDREKYQLFTISLDSGYSFWEISKLYASSAGNGFNEWGPNLAGTLFIASNDSEGADEAQVPSVQALVAMIQILQALGTAAGNITSEKLGYAEAYEKGLNSSDKAINMVKNAKMTAYAMMKVSTIYSLPILIFGAGYPDFLVKLFCKEEQSFELAKNMLRLTAFTILFQGWGEVWRGVLSGRNQPQDNIFATFTNLIIVAVGATVLGIFTQEEMGELSVFTWRMLGTLCAASLFLGYLENQGHSRVSTPIIKGNNCLIWKKTEPPSQQMPNVVDDYVDVEGLCGDDGHSNHSLSMSNRISADKQ